MKIQSIVNNLNVGRVNRFMDKYVSIAESPITNEINKMKYPLALYAKDNNVFVNLYQPDNINHENIYNLVITPLKRNFNDIFVKRLEINPEDKFIRTASKKVIVPCEHMTNLRVMTYGEQKIEDGVVSHIFREIQDAVSKIYG